MKGGTTYLLCMCGWDGRATGGRIISSTAVCFPLDFLYKIIFFFLMPGEEARSGKNYNYSTLPLPSIIGRQVAGAPSLMKPVLNMFTLPFKIYNYFPFVV